MIIYLASSKVFIQWCLFTIMIHTYNYFVVNGIIVQLYYSYNIKINHVFRQMYVQSIGKHNMTKLNDCKKKQITHDKRA